MPIFIISDKKIKQNIAYQLAWDGRIDENDVGLEVKKGKVLLKGSVPSYTAKRAAENDAWLVPGVIEVENKIMVEYPGHISRDDKEIKQMIHNVLVWNPDIDAAKIDIVVQNGRVTLSGTVENFWQKLKIERLVWDILGVIDVTDKIAVAPTEEFEDKIIAETILKSIDRNMNVDANSVNVKVENGRVFLSGIVYNKVAHDAAVDLIENMAGVVDLENNLVIKK